MNGLLSALRAIPSRAWVDVAVLAVLSLIGIVGFATAFDDAAYLRAGVGGLVVGVLVATASTALRLGALTTAGLAVIAFFVFGTGIAVPGEGILVVLPTFESLTSLCVGAVFGWADVVTLRAPASLPDYIAVVPYVATWVVGLAGGLLALRWLPRTRTTWRSSLLLAGPAVLYLASVLLGTDEPYHPGVRGVLFATIALIWLGWRRGQGAGIANSRPILWRKVRGTAIVVVAAATVGALGGAVLAPAPDDRFVLREEIQPPFDPLEYPSPLAGFRNYTKNLTDDVLFRVRGLERGQYLRLATMDSYDGRLWNVASTTDATSASGTFRLVGRDIPEPPLVTDAGSSRVSIEIEQYSDVWMPSVGYQRELLFDDPALAERADDLRYNAATGTAVITSRLESGAAYEVVSIDQALPAEGELAETPTATVQLPNARNSPPIIAEKAAEFSRGETSPFGQLRAIELTLRNTGFLSHGAATDSVPSRAGHGADRMIELFERSQMVGDQEQYASAFALMARSLDYPARVVMGFAPDVPEGATEVDVVGDDVTAWVEVAFEGYGWVPFFPTPEETDVPQDQTPKPKSEPQPQVRQPPRTDDERDDLVTAVEIEDTESDDDSIFSLPPWLVALLLSILIPALLLLIPALVVGFMKARRERRRRSTGSGDLRVAGAWDELLDRFAELGYDVPERLTRSRTAAELGTRLPDGARASTATIAREADDAVFSGAEIDPDRVDRAWTESRAAAAAAYAAASTFRRLLSRYRIGAASRWAARVSARAQRSDAERRR